MIETQPISSMERRIKELGKNQMVSDSHLILGLVPHGILKGSGKPYELVFLLDLELYDNSWHTYRTTSLKEDAQKKTLSFILSNMIAIASSSIQPPCMNRHNIRCRPSIMC